MISRRQLVKQLAFGPALLGSGLFEQLASAAAASPASNHPPTLVGKGVMVRQILMQPLPSTMGHNSAAVVVVDFAPDTASPPHRHPGVVFGYVLEGAVEIALNSAAPILYRKGDSWYEPPRVLHRVARNKSSTEPARILAFLIVEKGHPLVEPAEGAA